ncbi:acyl carrier protein [Microbulbifer aggregans]|uniref:acyl carrier protein n=1 Tax=Microbulbifer aggregans TaxID=1769779 RepID=UPI001CFCC886|nr:acyl carrier protein [Microbulbifer aggregans]
MVEYKEKIKSYIASDLGIDMSKTSYSDPLFTSGLMDSFALIELLAFMEQELGAEVDVADIYIDKIDSIDSLTALIK